MALYSSFAEMVMLCVQVYHLPVDLSGWSQ